MTLASSSLSWEQVIIHPIPNPVPAPLASLSLAPLLTSGPLTPGQTYAMHTHQNAHLTIFAEPRESNEGGEFSRMGVQESQSPPPSNLPVTGERTKNNPCASVFVECSPLTLHIIVSQQNPEGGAVFLLSNHCVSPQAPPSPVGVGS